MAEEVNKNKNNEKPTSKPQKAKGKKKDTGKSSQPKFSFNLYWIYAIVIVIFLGSLLFNSWSVSLEKITRQQLDSMMVRGDVAKVLLVNKTNAEIFVKSTSLAKKQYKDVREKNVGGELKGPHYTITPANVEVFSKHMYDMQEKHPDTAGAINFTSVNRPDYFSDMFIWLLIIGIFVVLWIVLMRRMRSATGGGQLFNIGKSKAKLFDKEKNVVVNFENVAGLDGAKMELMEIVDFLKNPKKYTNLGAKIPKGALLVGSPGTGKTLLAKAVAGEAKVPFFSLSGSDFVEMFVGVGASRVRDLFRQAKEKAPVIVFIDEIDAIGRARGRSMIQGGNDERENTLNQLLTEMDGFDMNTGVIILAATNRADVLDHALLRPGRFDRQIHVDLPDLIERHDIFKVHIKPLKKINKDVDIEILAKQTPGFSGADIANVCNEAALIAARKSKDTISKSDFSDAIDRVIGGLEKKHKLITPKEKKVIAYHEAGHATVSWLLKHASPLVKVTIIPRGQSLGAAWYLPEERHITTTEQLFDEMAAALGGRAAEQITFGQISTGALSDLEKITKQAYAMISIYGLNKKIGNLSYYDSSGQNEYAFTKPYSEKTAEAIDEEVKKLTDEAYNCALDLLEKNKEKLNLLAERLLAREVLFREDLEEIFGKREEDTEKDKFNTKAKDQKDTLEKNEAEGANQ